MLAGRTQAKGSLSTYATELTEPTYKVSDVSCMTHRLRIWISSADYVATFRLILSLTMSLFLISIDLNSLFHV
jgi:hypothetical protein